MKFSTNTALSTGIAVVAIAISVVVFTKFNKGPLSGLDTILFCMIALGALLSIFLIHRIRTGIKKQKLTEQKFSALLDAVPDATVIVNEKGIIQLINHQTETLFGYLRHELLGQPVELLMPEDLRAKHVHQRRGFFKIPKARSMGAGLELKAVKKDGTRFPVEISLSPFQTEEGLLVFASVRDISLRKELEDALNKTTSEMEAFTYSVSHDLRAPLRGIVGFTSILEEEYASKMDDEAKRITGVIKANTLKMGHLIDDLLAFSRMGKKELTKTAIDSGTMVRKVVEELSLQQKPGKTINWQINGLPEIYGDNNTLRQVWINLIGNAMKYSGRKEHPVIKISASQKDGAVVFCVKDNGVGFDEKYIDKLFKVFQRLHGAEEFEGTGIGLALVEKIVSKHGGRVWAEGKENEGACFYFSLPPSPQSDLAPVAGEEIVVAQSQPFLMKSYFDNHHKVL